MSPPGQDEEDKAGSRDKEDRPRTHDKEDEARTRDEENRAGLPDGEDEARTRDEEDEARTRDEEDEARTRDESGWEAARDGTRREAARDGTRREAARDPDSGLHEGTRYPPRDSSRVRATGLNERPPRHEQPGSRPPERRSGPPRDDGQRGDPVQESFTGQTDLYEIATWEPRTSLDFFAIRLTNALDTSRRFLLLSIALTLFFGQFAIAAVLILEAPLLGVLAVASALPALGLAGYFWYGDPTAREPLVGLAITFLLAVAFASIAGVVNSIARPFFQIFGVFGLVLFYFLVVGPIEETVKWLAVRVYAFRTDAFRTVVDGVVYGAMAGVGFAAIENLLYIIMFSVETTPAGIAVQEQEAVAVATQRAFVGPGHVIFSAWAGFYLGLAKFNQSKRGPIVVKGLIIAAGIHALYNTLVTTLPLTTITFVGFIIVFHGFWFSLLYRKISAYRELYRQRARAVR